MCNVTFEAYLVISGTSLSSQSLCYGKSKKSKALVLDIAPLNIVLYNRGSGGSSAMASGTS